MYLRSFGLGLADINDAVLKLALFDAAGMATCAVLFSTFRPQSNPSSNSTAQKRFCYSIVHSKSVYYSQTTSTMSAFHNFGIDPRLRQGVVYVLAKGFCYLILGGLTVGNCSLKYGSIGGFDWYCSNSNPLDFKVLTTTLVQVVQCKIHYIITVSDPQSN